MRPVFCGDLDFDCRDSDVERLFRRYGRVGRVDMKSGFAFVYMEDEHDAEVAIQKLDGIHFGRKGCKIRVEWTKRERGGRRDDIPKDLQPTHGLQRLCLIRKNFAFVQYELQEDATRALEASHRSNFMDRVISVEYANRDDDEQRNGYNPDGRVRDVSPSRRNYDRGHSPSPYQRDRGSPDYGRETLPSSRSEQRVGIGIALIMDMKHYQILDLSKGRRVALIMDVKSYQILELSKGKGVALILDVKLYPILDLNKATIFIMEQQKAL
ncbi:Serine/arginine-rich splicing factor RS40 [Sesamum angolense]|uniref:Serine/arginine-rich splicing factor RS40 n=1 Tax=Sesamum angolense TaxID=2727404 RepID=A0AAE1WPZ8_9LAMI|nr:Serine/arginine-rich splicing factor RS40 [Sesamum angolense]